MPFSGFEDNEIDHDERNRITGSSIKYKEKSNKLDSSIEGNVFIGSISSSNT